jgi:hypothetical protein
MLKVICGRDKIEVWFYHKILDPSELNNFTGVCFDESRRCSLAMVKLNKNHAYQGIAVCHPNDNFSRAVGRKRALRDAMYSLPENIRTAVWEEYKIRCGF